MIFAGLLNHISRILNVKRCLDFCTHLSISFGHFFSVNREQWTYLERNREKQMKTWHLQNIFDRAAAARKLLFENGLQTYKLILLSLWLMQSMNISFLQGLGPSLYRQLTFRLCIIRSENCMYICTYIIIRYKKDFNLQIHLNKFVVASRF